MHRMTIQLRNYILLSFIWNYVKFPAKKPQKPCKKANPNPSQVVTLLSLMGKLA